MALIDKPKIGREDGEVLVPVGQTFECDRDPNSIPKLRERHPRGSRKDAADVKACVTESQGEVTVRLQNSGRVVNGVGADPDIVVASAKAYLSALNKLQSKADRVAAQG